MEPLVQMEDQGQQVQMEHLVQKDIVGQLEVQDIMELKEMLVPLEHLGVMVETA